MRKTSSDNKPTLVYCIENLVNGKVYIGVSNEPKKRWKKHQEVAIGGLAKYPREYSLVHKAIVKYGIKQFSFMPFEYYETKTEAFRAEVFWIAEMHNYLGRENVYNLTDGGDGIMGCELPLPQG